MLPVHNDSDNANTGHEPDTPVQRVVEILHERGFDVHGPGDKESGVVTVIAITGARCEIFLADDGCMVWEYSPSRGSVPGPAEISGLVLRLLGSGPAGSPDLYADLHRAAKLKGAVAREMRARGLKAVLEVYEDEVFFDVDAGVVISNPDKPERGRVHVTDDGGVRWVCDDYGEMTGGAAAIAGTMADALSGNA